MVNKAPLKKSVYVGDQLFEELLHEFIHKKYGISKEELHNISEAKKEQEEGIPISILKNEKLSSLESIVKFLRENKNLSYYEIGKILCRNPKTLAVTYSVARKKMSNPFEDSMLENAEQIPFTAFNSRLSILEIICTYLKSKGKKYSEISRMIGKDQRTIWTVCKRAELKLQNARTTARTRKNFDKIMRNK
jgi:DNA-directed RNA polymerase specialized sigma24 family protein